MCEENCDLGEVRQLNVSFCFVGHLTNIIFNTKKKIILIVSHLVHQVLKIWCSFNEPSDLLEGEFWTSIRVVTAVVHS